MVDTYLQPGNLDASFSHISCLIYGKWAIFMYKEGPLLQEGSKTPRSGAPNPKGGRGGDHFIDPPYNKAKP